MNKLLIATAAGVASVIVHTGMVESTRLEIKWQYDTKTARTEMTFIHEKTKNKGYYFMILLILNLVI